MFALLALFACGGAPQPEPVGAAAPLPACTGVGDVAQGRFRVLAATWQPASSDEQAGDCGNPHYELSLAYQREEGACRLVAGRSASPEVVAMTDAARAEHLTQLVGKEFVGNHTIAQCWNEVGGDW